MADLPEDDDALARAFAARKAVDDGRAIQAGAADALGSPTFVAAGKGLNAGADALLSGSSLADAWAQAKSGYSGTADLNQKRNAEAHAAKPEAYDFGSALTAAVPMHGAESEPMPDDAVAAGFPGRPRVYDVSNKSVPEAKPEAPQLKKPGLLERIFGSKKPEGADRLAYEMKKGGFTGPEMKAAEEQLRAPSDFDRESQKRAALNLIEKDSEAVLGTSSLGQAFKKAGSPKQQEYLLDAADAQRVLNRKRENPQLSDAHLAQFESRPDYEVTSTRGADGKLHVQAVDSKGTVLGTVDFAPHPEGNLPGTVWVSPLRRGWDIGRDMYTHARDVTGKPMLSIPELKAKVGGEEVNTGSFQTPDGFGFRNSLGMKHLRAGPNATRSYLERLAAEKADRQAVPDEPLDWSSLTDEEK